MDQAIDTFHAAETKASLGEVRIEGRLIGAGVGAIMALVIGMTAGGAMRPTLATDGRPDGPQILTGRLAEGQTGPYDDTPTLASYSGRVPDYVVGSDTTRVPTAAVSPAATESVESADEPTRAVSAEDEAEPAVELSRTAYTALAADDVVAHAGDDDRASAETARDAAPQQFASTR